MRNVLLLVLVLLGLSGLAGWGPLGGLRDWFLGEAEESSTPYWCPMDPEIVRTGRGMCPICNMELVPFEGGSSAAEPGVLALSDRQVQQAGVRLDTARVRDLLREIDATGRLEVNPTRRTTVVLRYPGPSRLERVHVHAAGQSLREGDVVAEVQNATMLARLLEYRELLAEYAELRREGPEAEAAAGSVLELMSSLKKSIGMAGMPLRHLDVLAAKPKHLFTDPLFPVVASAAGTVLGDPTFFEGQVLREGTPLLELGDLSELWLVVELYEHELPLVSVGQTVEFTTLAVPDQVFRAPIRFIEPIVRERTQTVRARCRVWSEGTGLAPGMFVRARVACPVPAALSVPASAVLQSGRRNVVIVSEGGGRFRPRIVELGRRFLAAASPGDEPGFGASDARYHEVVTGVSAGERVVVAGIFLLNAEAQFQGVLQKMVDAHEAQANAPALEQELTMAFGMVLRSYDALRRGFVEDDPEALSEPARELAHHASMAAQRPSPVADGFARMAQASLGIAELAPTLPPGQNEEDPGWVRARTAFGALSREVVQYLRDYAPAKVATGELHLFRCPMADDFGFDLWVQPESELHNPYMGQWMVECGVPAELE